MEKYTNCRQKRGGMRVRRYPAVGKRRKHHQPARRGETELYSQDLPRMPERHESTFDGIAIPLPSQKTPTYARQATQSLDRQSAAILDREEIEAAWCSKSRSNFGESFCALDSVRAMFYSTRDCSHRPTTIRNNLCLFMSAGRA
jgi:hypothetical protein